MGVVAIMFSIWLLTFREKDLGDMMANLLDRLHIDPAHDFAVKLVDPKEVQTCPGFVTLDQLGQNFLDPHLHLSILAVLLHQPIFD